MPRLVGRSGSLNNNSRITPSLPSKSVLYLLPVELQPSFLVVMVTAVSPFFVCLQMRDKLCSCRFKRTFVLLKKLSFLPSEVAVTFIPAPRSEVVRTSCHCVWCAELEVNGLRALDSSYDLDDSVVWKSIFDLRELYLAGEGTHASHQSCRRPPSTQHILLQASDWDSALTLEVKRCSFPLKLLPPPCVPTSLFFRAPKRSL